MVDAHIGRFLIKQRIARAHQGRSGGLRAILFPRVGDRMVFLHVFAKSAKSDLTPGEATAYRDFASRIAELTSHQVRALIQTGEWIEIDCRKEAPQASQ